MYAKFERATWRNKTFRFELSDNAQWLWVNLLTTNRTTKCPGLIEATTLNIMEDLGWDWRGIVQDVPQHEKLIIGLQRTAKAMEELANTKRDDGTPWIQYSDKDRLVLLPRAVLHNLPQNKSIVNHWIKALDEYPDSTLKKEWIKSAYGAIKRTIGKDDDRYRLIKSIHLGRPKGRKKDDAEPSENTKEADTMSLPNMTPSTPETRHGVETISINSSSSSSISNSMNEEGRAPATPAPAPRSKGAAKGLDEKSKLTKPPEDFTDRQAQFFLALLETEFYIPGKGAMTAHAAIKDPVRLARNLGEKDTYPAVDPGLIKRLGGWTFENKAKAKRDIGRFILNRARATQEHGGPRTPGGGGGGGRYMPSPEYGDLAAKVDKTK